MRRHSLYFLDRIFCGFEKSDFENGEIHFGKLMLILKTTMNDFGISDPCFKNLLDDIENLMDEFEKLV